MSSHQRRRAPFVGGGNGNTKMGPPMEAGNATTTPYCGAHVNSGNVYRGSRRGPPPGAQHQEYVAPPRTHEPQHRQQQTLQESHQDETPALRKRRSSSLPRVKSMEASHPLAMAPHHPIPNPAAAYGFNNNSNHNRMGKIPAMDRSQRSRSTGRSLNLPGGPTTPGPATAVAAGATARPVEARSQSHHKRTALSSGDARVSKGKEQPKQQPPALSSVLSKPDGGTRRSGSAMSAGSRSVPSLAPGTATALTLGSAATATRKSGGKGSQPQSRALQQQQRSRAPDSPKKAAKTPDSPKRNERTRRKLADKKSPHRRAGKTVTLPPDAVATLAGKSPVLPQLDHATDPNDAPGATTATNATPPVSANASVRMVDYYQAPTLLSRLIQFRKFDAARQRLYRCPHEAGTWLVATQQRGTGGNASSQYTMKELPLHLACYQLQLMAGNEAEEEQERAAHNGLSQSPAAGRRTSRQWKLLFELFKELIVAYPDACRFTNHMGLRVLDCFVEYQASPAVVTLAILAHPEGMESHHEYRKKLQEKLQVSGLTPEHAEQQTSAKSAIDLLLQQDLAFWRGGWKKTKKSTPLLKMVQTESQRLVEGVNPVAASAQADFEGATDTFEDSLANLPKIDGEDEEEEGEQGFSSQNAKKDGDKPETYALAWDQLEHRVLLLEQLLYDSNKRNRSLKAQLRKQQPQKRGVGGGVTAHSQSTSSLSPMGQAKVKSVDVTEPTSSTTETPPKAAKDPSVPTPNAVSKKKSKRSPDNDKGQHAGKDLDKAERRQEGAGQEDNNREAKAKEACAILEAAKNEEERPSKNDGKEEKDDKRNKKKRVVDKNGELYREANRLIHEEYLELLRKLRSQEATIKRLKAIVGDMADNMDENDKEPAVERKDDEELDFFAEQSEKPQRKSSITEIPKPLEEITVDSDDVSGLHTVT